MGGVDLLEKAQEQERLLEESAKELQARQAKEEELRKRLLKKEAEQKKAEEKFTNMQEEADVKTRALKKAFHQLMSAKNEVTSSFFQLYITRLFGYLINMKYPEKINDYTKGKNKRFGYLPLDRWILVSQK